MSSTGIATNISATIALSPATAVPALADLAARAAGYARQTSAASTRAAYARDWADFSGWCVAMGLDPLPATPAVVGTYLTHLAERLAVATLGRRLAAISTAHRLAGQRLDTRHPAIRDLMRGIRRQHGTAQRRVAAATTGVVLAMIGSCGTSLLDLRDRALLLLGFAAALRRSELVALHVADVAVVAEGLRITLVRSKTDQEGAGAAIGVVRTGSATCPVAAVQAWLVAAAISDGKLFRSINRHGRIGAGLTDQSVALVVKKRAKLVGLEAGDFSGHSLRAGLATSAAAADVEENHPAPDPAPQRDRAARLHPRGGNVFPKRIGEGWIVTAQGSPPKGSAREKRWLIVAEDGRHSTIGRHTDPTESEIILSGQRLDEMELAGWLAVLNGPSYGNNPVSLLMVRPIARKTGEWAAAEMRWHEQRAKRPDTRLETLIHSGDHWHRFDGIAGPILLRPYAAEADV